MIKTIKLKFGSAPGTAPEAIELTPVTVFVGPNNSGKSKILSEVHRLCTKGGEDATDVILGSLEFGQLTQAEAAARIEVLRQEPRPTEVLKQGHVLMDIGGKDNVQIPEARLLTALQSPNSDLPAFCSWFLKSRTMILDGVRRIGLINQQEGGDLQGPPRSSFQSLLREDETRRKLSSIVHDALDRYLVIDPTNLGKLRLRLSMEEPEYPEEERGIHDAAVQFHGRALPIESASDGVKAFIGILSEVFSGDPSVLLLDEPEAFLHPSLAHKLGLELARVSSATNKRFFVSTHSPQFVMGCIQAGVPVNIIRLTYRGDLATARLLPSEDILKLMRHPLLRSTGVMSALFYEYVVVTESDADRAFYSEINERLLQEGGARGIPHCLFLNAQNKQTIQRIVRPLRALGIPVAGIVDVDILKDGGNTWSNYLRFGNIPELEFQSFAQLRVAVKRSLDATGGDMKRDGGVGLLGGAEQEAANNLFDRLAEYGIFTVRNGELESWLPELEVHGHGPEWLIGVFEKMGENPALEAYLRPEPEDVWAFVDSIAKWLIDPNRKGIPT